MIKHIKSVQAFRRSRRLFASTTMLLTTTADTMWMSDEHGLYWWQIDKSTILVMAGAREVLVAPNTIDRLQKCAWVFLSPLSHKHDRLGNTYVEIPS